MNYLKLIFQKYLLLTSLFSFCLISVNAQIRLDVEGDAKIRGSIDLIKADGDSSIFIGFNAGLNTIGTNQHNTFIGLAAGEANTSGSQNTYIGERAGTANITGFNNTFIGKDAGKRSLSNQNTLIGQVAGQNITTGGGNTVVGQNAGFGLTTGSNNVIMGLQAATNGSKHEKSTFIGVFAGALSGTDSLNKAIAIGHNAQVNCHNCAVIGGTGGDAVKVGIGSTTPIYTLDVQHVNGAPTVTPGNGFNIKNLGGNNNEWQLYVGDVSGKLRLYKNNVLRGTFDEVSGNYTPNSDKRLKHNIQTLENQLLLINRLRPTSYHFNGRKTERKVYGLIAQEVQKVIPDIVLENEGDIGENKTLGISYTELIPVLIAGMQEQQKMIQNRDEVVKDLAIKLAQLEDRLEKMEDRASNQLPSTAPALQELPLEQITLNTPMLWQNTPNPFNEWTQIQYAIPEGYQQAIIQITNQQGQVVHTKAIASGGQGSVNVQIGNAAQGNYFYSLILDGQIFETKQMVLTK